ncbi:CMRF35-like molecule 5 [Muntiacus reevesi]|uniref:CMRF35-like molecule 5 n=1 Tax=Muntiacus reevesi TaxID=9886 RepID=UPI003307B916
MAPARRLRGGRQGPLSRLSPSGSEELHVLKASQDCGSNGVQLSEALRCFWTWPVCAPQRLVRDTGWPFPRSQTGELAQGPARQARLGGAVRGVEQESLTVRCRYDPGYESYVKWWCRGADRGSCRIVVKTTGSEKEVKKGRVSIRDNWKDRSFTVTMEKLRLNDSDTYWCGIERSGPDLGYRIEVTIDPAPTVSIPTPATSTPATSSANMLTAPVAPEENQGQLPLLGSVHFLLLVFLKVPLLLSLLGAVLWVNRPLRSSRGKPQENQQPPCSSTLSREKDPQREENGIFLRQ